MPGAWNDGQIIHQLNSGVLWSAANLSYGFPATASWFPYAEKNGFSPLSGAQQNAATRAIELWDDLIANDIRLSSSPNTADIKFSNTTSSIGYAHAYFPGSSAAAGSVWFNPDYATLTSPTVGSYGFMTFMHEIGHALGLDHPGTYNGGSPTYAKDALYAQDTHQYTVMSYFDAENTGADWYAPNGNWYYPQTPMLHDVMAIQAMYGADMATRSGDTVYGFNSTAGQVVFNFNSNRHPVLTIWDGGGVDTLDLSGFQTASVINLAPGSYSNCDAMTGNLAIAHGAWIENATGGGGNDTVTGNDRANILAGGGGNDSLNGGNGNDTLDGGLGRDILAGGAGDDFLYYDAADNLVLLSGGSGFDTLIFADSFIAFDLAGHALEQAMVTMVDLGAETWDALNDFYDVSGNRLRQDLFNDDGTMVVTDWDVYDQETWQHRVRTYDAQGVLVSEVVDGEPVPDDGDGGEPLNPTGTEGADTLLGDDGDNVFSGLGGADTLNGLDGADFMNGGAGADRLDGGAGDDTFIVDSAGDVVTESSGGGVDLVMSSVTYDLRSSVENLTLTGGDAINGIGNGGGNTLIGNNVANTLKGGAGQDRLNGEGGRDALTGGKGADRFVFDDLDDMATGSARDVISDFSRAQGDEISLAGIDADGNAANGDQSFALVASFSGAAGQLRFDSAAKIVAGDIDGDGLADFEIGVNVSALAASDFIL